MSLSNIFGWSKKEGYEQMAAIFLKTADNEKEHAIFFPYPKSYCTDVKDFMYDDMDGVLEPQEYKAVKDYDKIICMIGEIGYYYPARVWIGNSGRLFCTHEYDEEVLVFDDVIELIRYEIEGHEPETVFVESVQP